MNYNELIYIARDYGERSDWDKAIEYFEKAFELQVLTDDYLDLAICYVESGNSYKGLKIIDEVISYYPEYERAHYYKGIYYEHLELYDEAVKEYKKSIELGNNEAETYYKIGLLYDEFIKLDDVELIKYYYLKALSINDKHFYANLNLGAIYEHSDELDKALKYTLKAHDEHPNNPYASYNLGVVYCKMNDFETAKKYYLEELSKNKNSSNSYYNIGLIYSNSKDYQNAKECYLKALQIDKEDYRYWFNLACVYSLTMEYENCFNCLNIARMYCTEVDDFVEEDEELSNFRKTDYYLKYKKS